MFSWREMHTDLIRLYNLIATAHSSMNVDKAETAEMCARDLMEKLSKKLKEADDEETNY